RLRRPSSDVTPAVREAGKQVGLAETAVPATQPSGVTQEGAVMGTPMYMAPEVYEGIADARSDVFAMGVVLYELIAGVRPFVGERGPDVMAAVLYDEPKPIDGEVPERVAAIA